MPSFHHILFPVDFSERSKAFRPYVKLVANQLETKLTLLHVIQIPTGTFGDIGGIVPWLRDDFKTVEEKIQETLTDFMEFSTQDRILSIQSKVLDGDPANMIVEYARKNAIDLIMMPTHGHGKFRSLMLGSVAGKVLHDSDRPIWTAAHTENPAAMVRLRCHNILAAIELDREPVKLIQFASGLAKDFGAVLRVVHAVPGAGHAPAAREQIEKLQGQSGIAFEYSIVTGDAGDAVPKTAADCRADLVVLGPGRVHAALSRFRSDSYRIIREAPCPVLNL